MHSIDWSVFITIFLSKFTLSLGLWIYFYYILSISLIRIEFSLLLKLLNFYKIAEFLNASISDIDEFMFSTVLLSRFWFIMLLFDRRFLPHFVPDIFRDVRDVDCIYFDLLGTDGSGNDLLLS